MRDIAHNVSTRLTFQKCAVMLGNAAYADTVKRATHIFASGKVEPHRVINTLGRSLGDFAGSILRAANREGKILSDRIVIVAQTKKTRPTVSIITENRRILLYGQICLGC